ncbi:threonylcarbamoyl-AMP synthase [Candidatus Dependentiae bacterium]|nr:threonylcarbamoyl-AMP synthase [Candidatus Dependentiae bacterium]
MQHKTKLLQAHSPKDIATAIALLKAVQIVALPTETVYGLAADAKNPDAVRKIFVAKKRPSSHPLIVHIASFAKIHEWAQDISPLATILAEHFWPGPLTLLLHKKPTVNDVVTGGLPTIALRVPQHPLLLEILETLDTGLAAPSANQHKRLSPTRAQHVMDGLAGKIAAVLDGGACTFGLESTIVDLTGSVPTILRPGPITQQMLEDTLRMVVLAPEHHTEQVAGNMVVHYQPRTQTVLMPLMNLQEYLLAPANSIKKIAVMHYSHLRLTAANVQYQAMPQDKAAYARAMYHVLHQLDRAGVDQILIETPPNNPVWRDVLDRLTKASACNKNILSQNE